MRLEPNLVLRDNTKNDAPARNAPEIVTQWRIVLTAFTGIFLGFPTLLFYSVGTLAPAMARELGWSFGTILGGLGIMTTVLVVSSPMVGYLADRVGAKRLALVSSLLFPPALASFAASGGSIPVYYCQWLLVSLAGVGLTPIIWSRLISLNIERQRGFALGLALTGTGLFIVLGKPLVTVVSLQFGWRAAFLALAALPLATVLPMVHFWYKEPAQRQASASLPPRGKSAADVATRPGSRSSNELLRKHFWLMAPAFLLLSFGGTAPLPNIENILASDGVGPRDIVYFTGLLGGATIVGRVSAGLLLDRFWAPGVAAFLLTPGALACWWLSTGTSSPAILAVAMILLGVTVSSELDLLAFLTARYLGLRKYGLFYGILFGIFSIGAGIGPAVMGRLFDTHHNYDLALRLAALSFLAAVILLLALGRYPRANIGADRQ